MTDSQRQAELQVAEAGIAMAMSADVDECCRLLHAWTLRLLGASAAGATYVGELGTVDMGMFPDDVDPAAAPSSHETAREGWHVLVVPCPPDVQQVWTARLWLADPALPGWQVVADLLVRQAGVGLARVLRRTDLARHERQQHALVEAGKALSSERTLDGVLRRIVEHAMELTGARYGALGVLDDDREALSAFVTVGIDARTQALIGELPQGRGLLGVLIEDPRPLRLKRLQDHPSSVGFPEHHPPMGSFLGVPIVTARGVAGRIYLTEKANAAEFSAEDEQLVQTLASQAAIAIGNASLNEQLQRTAAELAEASRHKSVFLANMSHELRSPLNTIIGYTRLLLEEPERLEPEQVEDLEIVRGSSEHLLALITDLLDLQRIEAGRVTLVLDEEDLRAIVDTVAASSRPSLAPGVALLTDTSALRDPILTCDRTRLRQVLLNVLGNAVKFTDSGSVSILARDDEDPDGSELTIEVCDTGPGIAPDEQERIFESFYQSTGARGRTPGPREGAGLGLAITRMLTELHGGAVSISSEVGVGTTITIRLPRSAATSVATPVLEPR